MDQFSAHLDRGWDLVQRGDSQGAELSARRALEIDSQSPEAYNLLGYVAALQGEFEDAIEHYRQAIALDDTYFEAMLNAAEIYIHPLADYDAAIEMCDTALDLAETDDEVVDALLLKFDALLGQNRMEDARVLCSKFPKGPFENPNHAFLVGRALYEVGSLAEAAPLIDDAVKSNPENAEAFYYQGLVRDDRGDTAGATESFLRARELDLELPGPPWALSRETFEQTVRRIVDSLDEKLRRHVRAGEIYVSDVPGIEVVVDGVDPRALLMLDAIGPTGPDGLATARLFVYRRNLERVAGTVDHVEEEVKAALEREIRITFIENESVRAPHSLN
ncbi:MAG TPA: tetratricopeptide repeat protein [Polyangiaceae bacterium]|nr:tetratricopeptide repeat protein [Polyangiaceae bacterium]